MTDDALLARVNHVLSVDRQKIIPAKTADELRRYGRYRKVSEDGVIAAAHVDLLAVAVRLGVAHDGGVR